MKKENQSSEKSRNDIKFIRISWDQHLDAIKYCVARLYSGAALPIEDTTDATCLDWLDLNDECLYEVVAILDSGAHVKMHPNVEILA